MTEIFYAQLVPRQFPRPILVNWIYNRTHGWLRFVHRHWTAWTTS